MKGNLEYEGQTVVRSRDERNGHNDGGTDVLVDAREDCSADDSVGVLVDGVFKDESCDRSSEKAVNECNSEQKLLLEVQSSVIPVGLSNVSTMKGTIVWS